MTHESRASELSVAATNVGLVVDVDVVESFVTARRGSESSAVEFWMCCVCTVSIIFFFVNAEREKSTINPLISTNPLVLKELRLALL